MRDLYRIVIHRPLCIHVCASFLLAMLAMTPAWSQRIGPLTISVETSGGAATRQPEYINGYRSSVSGQTITYHSSHPDADDALLCRVRRDALSISWLTDTLPALRGPRFYRLVWLAGIERIGWGNATHPHTFHLSINGDRWFTFTNRKDSTAPRWTVSGKNGAELSFESRKTDKFGDLFGFMSLKLPRKAFPPGRPLLLRVDGEDADSPEWYMTFQHPFDFLPRVSVEPALLREGDGTKAVLRLSLDNLAAHRTVRVNLAGKELVRRQLEIGANIFLIPVSTVSSEQLLPVVFKVSGHAAGSVSAAIRPVKELEIYLIPHTHNDIGYTDIQPNVERKQWDNFDRALELIRKTKTYPKEARFKWNAEILWPLESYLRHAPAEKQQELLRAITEGSIGLNALYVNPLTGLATSEEMSHFTDYARQFTQEYSVPITTAAVSDIPGFTWGIVSSLAQSGVKYFASAPNNGDRIGYVTQAWGDKPFYWASQSGEEKVLFWLAGSGYATFHEATLSQFGPEKLMKLSRKIFESGYPYNMYYLPYTLGDNGGPDSNLSGFVRDWNERYVSPKLIIATHRQLFEEFERRYGATLSTYKGDFTPYWEDGAASTASETARNRHVTDRLTQGEALWCMRSPEIFPERQYYEAWEKVSLWDEHTWGADKSVTDPDDPGAVEQWRFKQRYVLDSDSASLLLLGEALSSSSLGFAPNAFNIYNTNSWTRTDVVFLSKEQSGAGDRVEDDRRTLLPSQRLSTGQLAVIVRDIPPMSSRSIYVKRGSASIRGNVSISSSQLRNEFVTITLDTVTGAITGCTSLDNTTSFVEPSPGLNTYLYVRGKNADSAVSLSNVRVTVKERGSVYSSFLVQGEAPGCRSYSSEIRMMTGLNRVDIVTTMDKISVREKEGMHIAFPFAVPGGQLRYDVADAIVRPEKDQLEGACKNFFSVNSFVDISNEERGITWATPDAPLIEIGRITAESPWMKVSENSQRIYSYIMNNYWHTNYKADQSGKVTFGYSLQPHGKFNAAEAVRFGVERRQPLIVSAAGQSVPVHESLFTITPSDVIVQSVKPLEHGRAFLVNLYNPGDSLRHADIRWNAAGASFYLSSGFEEQGESLTTIELQGHDSRYILVRKKR